MFLSSSSELNAQVSYCKCSVSVVCKGLHVLLLLKKMHDFNQSCHESSLYNEELQLLKWSTNLKKRVGAVPQNGPIGAELSYF